MKLLVALYTDSSAARMNEFVECARRNAANEFIDDITIFLEDATSPGEIKSRFQTLAHPKIYLHPHGRRTTFDVLFDFANRTFPGLVVGVANCDIFFDETLGLLDAEPMEGRLLCLSRWEQLANGSLRHFDAPNSQDAWIFESPFPRIKADFFLGRPGCDNRLAYEAEQAGLKLANPSRSIRARHLHNSGVRRYSDKDRYPGPLRFVPSSFVETPNGAGHSLEGFPSHRSRKTARVAEEEFHKIAAVLKPFFAAGVPRRVRRELLIELKARAGEAVRPTECPLAKVAFREVMGFTLARLEPGVSTHNNDPRPIVSIPPALAGLQFSQVVSCHSAPVRIEFRTRGRLFVLAAQGWEGHAPASAFLDRAGWREPGPPIRTQNGTTFDVWTLFAEAGEWLVIPVQVMLASEVLTRLT